MDSLIVQGAKGQGNNVLDGLLDWDFFSKSVIFFGLYWHLFLCFSILDQDFSTEQWAKGQWILKDKGQTFENQLVNHFAKCKRKIHISSILYLLYLW